MRIPRNCLAFASLVLFASTLPALSIDGSTFEELLADADFVGVVRCDVAGGIVAGYVVEETWAGTPNVGDHIRICDLPDTHENPLPYRLCGERLVVAARDEGPFSADIACPFPDEYSTPVVRRNLDTTYTLPWRQGVAELAGEQEGLDFGREFESLDRLRKKAQEFLLLSDDAREELVLKTRFRAAIDASVADATVDRAQKLKAMLANVEAAKGAKATVLKLLEIARADEDDGLWSSYNALEHGLAITLLTLGKVADLPYEGEERQYLMQKLLHRVVPTAYAAVTTEPEAEEPDHPTDAEFLAARNALAADPLDWQAFHSGAQLLARWQPLGFADWLCSWNPPGKSEEVRQAGVMELAYWFCSRLQGNRADCLKTLAAAERKELRVVAASYWMTFDEASARPVLTELAKLDDPYLAALAALPLARRGDKDALAVGLKVFGSDAKRNLPIALRDVLKKRYLILLSNSAATSGVAQPPDGRKLRYEKSPAAIEAWWVKVRGTISLNDPWLEELAKTGQD
ncbi:MAG: hypothetical protein KDB90_04765 [Planctomycetes bacterium]|nr:hypothetical protein [Planctomycetota bacterium]